MQDYEKLGAFYLGKRFDDATASVKDELLLYDAKDLTTHAVCVGMTGSGKTGLCLSLLEEAAIDGIPAIVIDPKGDLGNLLLTFPELKPADFLPWVDAGTATRKGLTKQQYATQTAKLWRDGLAEWGQDADRIRRLRAAADFAIYTPGSNAGLPLSVLKSFDAPGEAVRKDGDALRDRVQAAVSGLLGMLGINADPIQSREHILLSNLLHRAWQQGRNMDLPSLIQGIQQPPFDKLGVFDLESFYPAKERFGLAMSLNNLLASPGFEAWMEGEGLNIQRLLTTPDGRPRISILSIAHLSDAERMFFVTLLLNELVAWMRSQPGTSSLRALLYMDEIYGYFPPTANPPSKTPMLTLLKQARAFGLGCVLATQNPVDLDYKGLSNTGTWFIGRLQTERDKARVLDGLEGASGSAGQSFDRAAMERTLSGLGNRVFLMNNVHDDEPVLFQTRWVMSYLRGPLTRTQIEEVMRGRKQQPALTPPAPPPPPVVLSPPAGTDIAEAAAPSAAADKPPALSAKIPQIHIEAVSGVPAGQKLFYRPALGAIVKLHFARVSAKTDVWLPVHLLAPIPQTGRPVSWDAAEELASGLPTAAAAAPCATFADLPTEAAKVTPYRAWEKELKQHLYQNRQVTVWKCAALKTCSDPDEQEGDFRARLRHIAHERRDLEKEKLRKKYGPKLATLQNRVRKAAERVDRERAQYKHQKLSTAISVGTTLLGALFGRRTSVGTFTRAGTAMRRAGQSSREKGDIGRAESDVKALQEKLDALEQEFEQAVADITEKYQAEDLDLEAIKLRPRKSDITVSEFALAWTPWHVDAQGIAVKAY
jgi:hypothetical protein